MLPYGYALECMASAYCARELQVEGYSKHLANSNRLTPLLERRARNLSSPMFVVWQQYGEDACYERTRKREERAKKRSSL